MWLLECPRARPFGFTLMTVMFGFVVRMLTQLGFARAVLGGLTRRVQHLLGRHLRVHLDLRTLPACHTTATR